MTSIVGEAEWRADTLRALSTVQGKLRRRAEQQGLSLCGRPSEAVEVILGDLRVRITISAEAEPVVHPAVGPRVAPTA
ncbi:hypothetical protein [Kineococcus sp. SYSU DK005]|uniref:hypothetical protein n=1 Tax=Kineococcus sp. SYSU DK005 TaxID=3383126 RepID=UPI003D7DF704